MDYVVWNLKRQNIYPTRSFAKQKISKFTQTSHYFQYISEKRKLLVSFLRWQYRFSAFNA